MFASSKGGYHLDSTGAMNYGYLASTAADAVAILEGLQSGDNVKIIVLSATTLSDIGAQLSDLSQNHASDVQVSLDISACTNLTSIGMYTFTNCYCLWDIKLPGSLQTIGAGAFNYCNNLGGITIPASVTSIGESAFENTGLWSIDFEGGSQLRTIGAAAFKNAASLGGNTGTITIPDSVTSIGNGAFYGVWGITTITIPSGVTSIPATMFYGCSYLETISISGVITSIGANAFAGCRNVYRMNFGYMSITDFTNIDKAVNWRGSGATMLQDSVEVYCSDAHRELRYLVD